MKSHFLIILLLCLAIISCKEERNKELTLWYDCPAKNWNEALPIGNGHIAAMVYGGTTDDVYDLNEETIYTGSPYNNSNPKALGHLQEIRNLIFDNKSDSAQSLAEKYITADETLGRGAMYQPAASLHIKYNTAEEVDNYRRSLSLDSALATTSYTRDGVDYKTECFTSLADNIMAIRISASEANSINFTTSFSHPSDNTTCSSSGNTITLTGTTDSIDHVIPGEIRFTEKAKVVTQGGEVINKGGEITVKDASEVTIYIVIATNFKKYNDISGDPEKKASALMSKSNLGYKDLRSRHIRKYQEQFNRVSLTLSSKNDTKTPTNERIKKFYDTGDMSLVELLYQYGRYLLISSSQPGCQPANLQGKWNKDTDPSWGSRYTLNINTEMNYWPANVSNLMELNTPLNNMIEDLSKQGEETAKTMYGCRGWVTHHNTDLWRMTGSINKPMYGAWPMAGAWLCEMMWQQYLYSGDKKMLLQCYQCQKGAALFFIDYLVKQPKTDYLVTCPSLSPENGPEFDKDTHLYAGVAMDNELLYSLFSHTAEAAKILNCDNELREDCLQECKKLMPLLIGKGGHLQEWAEDWDSPHDKHRHVSHLWGLYPGSLISPFRCPLSFISAGQSLEWRGDASTGWSIAWKLCLWARLLDGDHAFKLVCRMFNPIDSENNEAHGDGGIYPNMLCAHPPFQIDGNLGFTAGVSEMLVQSHDGFVWLLPSIPNIWKSGCVKGLRTQGGFIIKDLEWKEGKLTHAVILSTLGGNLRIRSYQSLKCNSEIKIASGAENTNPLFSVTTMPACLNYNGKKIPTPTTPKDNFGTNLYDIMTKPGQTIELIP